jgi:release factor glutamine methyltransferase
MADSAPSADTGAGMCVGELVRVVREQLSAAGVESPALDAELIVGAVTGMDRVQLRTRSEQVPGPRQQARIRELTVRGAAHEPVQYLVGRAPFRTIELRVDARALIPRPETELLVELALEHVGRAAREAWPVRVLDVCTGSGAVAVAVAVEAQPGSVAVTGTDISADALDLAAANAAEHRVAVALLAGDLLEPVAGREFDVIVANPPYVARADEPSLAANVRDHEPHLALFVDGDDPLALARGIVRAAAQQLAPGGLLAIEIGMGQHAELEVELRECGYVDVGTRADLQGIGRAVHGRWSAA